ncbi:hypothetical protein GGU45_001768 [Niabella hirudinis]
MKAMVNSQWAACRTDAISLDAAFPFAFCRPNIWLKETVLIHY